MTTKPDLQHMIVFLPGIMGSVLQKDGRDVWALSGTALFDYLRPFRSDGGALQQLILRDDDWQRADLGDGIKATRIIEDLHSVPPLIQHAGYSTIMKGIKDEFGRVTAGSIDQPQDDANFFPFPYDWRRDNRASALKLKAFIDAQLPRWRKWSGKHDAQVIIVAHSMGGLVARYYLEVLEGWRTCGGLITVGTPHRGAPNAIETLSNGINKQLFGWTLVDLSELLRSFTSIYQLLPVYPCVQVNGAMVRPAETAAIPFLDQERARIARESFHNVIREQAITNRQISGYVQRTLPWVGIHQDTAQSAFLEGGRVLTSLHPLANVDAALATGDGTVPRVSAVPSDWSEGEAQQLPRFSAEQHGWLTNNEMTLTPLLETLRSLVASGMQNLHGKVDQPQAALNLRIDPLVAEGEPVTAQIELVGNGTQPQAIEIRLQALQAGSKRITQPVSVVPGQRASIEFAQLSPGLYRVEARARGQGRAVPVHSTVEVVPSTGDA